MATRIARHSAPGPSDRVDRTLLVRSRGIVTEPSTAMRPTPSGAVLTATKIQIPGVRSGLVRRARLVALLTGATEAKLALLQAPGGSGKTTLLAEWHAAAQATRPFAWLSLDRGDNDPTRFVEGVIAALGTVVPGRRRAGARGSRRARPPRRRGPALARQRPRGSAAAAGARPRRLP